MAAINGNPPRQIKEVKRCVRCEKTFMSKTSNFPNSYSPLFKSNEGYLPWCNRCVDELFDEYIKSLGSEKAAVKRLCLKFDIYWNELIFDKLPIPSATSSVMRTYIMKAGSYQHRGKTYDTTLEESAIMSRGSGEHLGNPDYDDNEPELIEAWGPGFTSAQLRELEERYRYWTKEKTFANREEEGLYRNIAKIDWQINKALQMGGKTDSLTTNLDRLLNSAGIKGKTGGGNGDDNRPFGVKIRDWENEHPIPDPDPEFQDVDNIVKYISIYYLGHLCKMFKIKNKYNAMYEEEMNRYRVEHPEYENEDDEGIFEAIFDSDKKTGE